MTRKEEQWRAVKNSRGGGGKVRARREGEAPERAASDQLSNTRTAFYLKKRIRPPLHQPQQSEQSGMPLLHGPEVAQVLPAVWAAWWCWEKSRDGCREDTEQEPPSQAGVGALGSLPTKVREQAQLENRSHRQGWRPGVRQSGRWARGSQGQVHSTLAGGLGAPGGRARPCSSLPSTRGWLCNHTDGDTVVFGRQDEGHKWI